MKTKSTILFDGPISFMDAGYIYTMMKDDLSLEIKEATKGQPTAYVKKRNRPLIRRGKISKRNILI